MFLWQKAAQEPAVGCDPEGPIVRKSIQGFALSPSCRTFWGVMVELLSVGGVEGCSSRWLDTLVMHSLIGQPWRHISNHAPWGAVAAASIFGTGDSICLGLCLCAAGNVCYCICFLIVFEFSWVMITILFILHCLNLVHMELSAHPPRVVTCGFFMARGLEREGRTAIC